MPEVEAFLRGFNLLEGKYFASYKLVSVMATHNSVVRYKEYRYTIKLTFDTSGNVLPTRSHLNEDEKYVDFYKALMDKIKASKIIKSAYGNPYECGIDEPVEGDIIEHSPSQIIVNLTGHSYRV